DDSAAAEVEQRVLARAEDRSLGEFRSDVQRAVIAVDPASPDERHKRTVADRRVELYSGEHGTATVGASNLPATNAETICSALAGYGAISPDMARLLAADGNWRRLVTDPTTGHLLDYGRTVYKPPADLSDFVIARDKRCRFPSCRKPGRKCDIDHGQAWADGGTTCKENNCCLCERHHRLKDAPG